METDKTALERAFALAESGDFASVGDVKKQLAAEGYSNAQITGPRLLRQLRDIIKLAGTARA